VSSAAGRAGLPAFAAAVVLALFLGAMPVLAHAELVSSDPADGAQLATPPATITLTFSEGLVADRSSFQLNLAGTTIGNGNPVKDGDTAMTLGGLSLDAGDYLIRWTSVADDGDLLRGTIRFTVLAASPTPAPTPTPTPASTSPSTSPATPTASAPQVTPSASPSPSPDPAQAGSTGGDVLIPILVGLVLVAGVGAFVLRRSRGA
jgi:methionine-rich copper-binding protein CopC